MGFIKELKKGLNELMEEDSVKPLEIKEYHIKLQDILTKFNIKGQITYSSYDYKTKILQVKIK